jgi:hypothetical protein
LAGQITRQQVKPEARVRQRCSSGEMEQAR